MDMNEAANEGRGVRGEYEEDYEAPFAIAVRYLSVPRRPSNGGTNRRVQWPTGRGGFQSPIRGDGRGPNAGGQRQRQRPTAQVRGPPTDCRKEPIVYLTLDRTPALPGEFEKIYRIFPFTNPGVKRPRI